MLCLVKLLVCKVSAETGARLFFTLRNTPLLHLPNCDNLHGYSSVPGSRTGCQGRFCVLEKNTKRRYTDSDKPELAKEGFFMLLVIHLLITA